MAKDTDYKRQADLEAAIAAAEHKRSQGDLVGTYEAYRAIAAGRLGGNPTAADLTILQSLADLAALFGDFQPADDLWVSLVVLCRQANNLHRADFGTIKRIHLALDRGLLQQATDLFAEMAPRIGSIQAIDITPSGLLSWEKACRWPNTDSADRTILLTLLYLAMGRLLSALGQYRDALEMLNRGLTHATPGDSQTLPSLARRQVPWFQLAIAQTCLESGLLPETEAVLTALQPQLGSPQERVFEIQWHTLAGKLALLQGIFGQALEHFQAILTLCHRLKIQRGVVMASLNLAQVLIVLNQNQLATSHLSSIAADVEQSQDAHLIARLALLQRLALARSQSLVAGSTFSVSDLLQTAPLEPEPSQTEAPAIPEETEFSYVCSQSPQYLTFFEDRVLEFQWYLSQSNLPGAASMLAHIQAVFAHTDSQLILTKVKALQGMLAYYQGLHQLHRGDRQAGTQQIQLAAVMLDEVRSPLARMNLKPEQWQIQRILGWCLIRLHSPSHDQERLADETNQLLETLTQSLSAKDQVIFLLNKWTADEEYIATQIVRLRLLQKQARQAPLHQRLHLGWRLLRQLNALINHVDHYRTALTNRVVQAELPSSPAAHLPLWKRLVQHPWGRATFSFLVLPDQVFVVRHWRFWLDFSVVPVTRLELRNLVTQWYTPSSSSHTERSLSPNPEPDPDLAPVESREVITQTLAEKLNLSSLLRLPRYIRRLTIVPDDVLHIFPFAVFPYQEKYLIEAFALSLAYRTTDVNSAVPSRPTKAKTRPLLVGVATGGNQLKALPGVHGEIALISKLLTQLSLHPHVMVDQAVNKQALIDRLASTSFLHIACHGIFEHQQAHQSGLVLNTQQTPLELLSLRDIAALDLTGIKHITLSACSSADHLVLPGRWVISLPEVLHRAGAESILGNLWEVYDQLAIAFMERFYTYLQNLPRDRALQRVQLDCLNQRLPNSTYLDLRDPKCWAGFSVYGQPEFWQPW
jgi:tetratricopeptide (TPR) repeat protein